MSTRHRNPIKTEPWYGKRLFAKPAQPIEVREERDVIPTLDRRPSRTLHLTALMPGCWRPIDQICIPRGDGYLLELLGLEQLGNIKNQELARKLREMP